MSFVSISTPLMKRGEFMKKLAIMGALCLTSSLSLANDLSYKIGVAEIMKSDDTSKKSMVFTTDGQILEIDSENTVLLNQLEVAKETQQNVELTLASSVNLTDLTDERNEILSAKLASEPNGYFSPKMDIEIQNANNNKDRNGIARLMSDYVTDFNSESEVDSIHASLRANHMRRKSQCFNRAHVWSWELNQKRYQGQRIKTGKIWLFFTQKYINQYDYKWWFHIAPYVNLNGETRVLDKTFSPYGPEAQQQWTNNFMKNNERCLEVSSYSRYRNNQFERNCYIIKSSVHYWQPRQIEFAESKKIEQNSWQHWELKNAYTDMKCSGWFCKKEKVPYWNSRN